MEIHLIKPAWGQAKHFRFLRSTPPLGLAYVAAALIEAGHHVTVTDAVFEGYDTVIPYGPIVAQGLANADIVARIPAQAQVVGISVMATTDWPLVADLVHQIKRARPNVFVMLGGEHPSALPKLSLMTSGADAVVVGEGEETAVALMKAVAARTALSDVRGAARLDHQGRYIPAQPRARIQDLESLPQPAWHLFNIDGYQRRRFVGGALWQRRRSLPMLASRGCPYQCAFCTSPNMWTPLWVPRSPKAVVDEMIDLRDRYDVRDFSFHDLTMVVQRGWVLDLCREIVARDAGVSWQIHSGTRLEEIDDELLDHMQRAGLASLVLAPESASEGARKRVRKQMKTADIERAIRAAVGSGIPLKVQILNGFPGDRHADAWANVRFAVRLGRMGVDGVGTAIFAPYPGTALFDELLRKGEIEMGDDLVFFPVTNNDFSRPLLKSQRIAPGVAKAYQLATLGGFVASKFTFHPIASLRSLVRAVTNDYEKRYFDKLLRALIVTVGRLFVSPCRGAPATRPGIDYRRFPIKDLVRARCLEPGAAAQRECLGRAPHSPTPA